MSQRSIFAKVDKPRFLALDILPEGFVEALARTGFDVDCYEELYNDTLSPIIHRYAGIVVSTPITLNKEIIDKAEKLRYILRPGSGLDNVDVDYALSKGIKVFNSPEGNADAVGEHSLALLLNLVNNISRADSQVKDWQWIRQPNMGIELKGKTIGIIGYGNTGSSFAAKLAGLEVDVLVYDKYKKGFDKGYIHESTLEEIQQKALVVSLHIPLTAETLELVNADFINGFRHPFFLINTSRGKNVSIKALVEGMNSGKILGAALDVLPNERFLTYSIEEKALLQALMETGKVVMTPHIAGWTSEARKKIFFIVFEKFRDYLESSITSKKRH